MKTTILAAALALGLAGCRTVSAPALAEAKTAASVGEGVLTKWDAKGPDGLPVLSDDQKKKAVFKLTRAECSVVNSVDGTPIPDAFLTGPWATEDAVTTPGVRDAK